MKISNADFQAAYANSDYKKVIKSVLWKFSNSVDKSELYSCGLLGLWKCMKKHDPNHPSKQKFTSSLYRFVKWECLKAYRKRQKELKMQRLPRNLSYNAKNEKLEFLKEAISELRPIYQDILNMFFIEKHSIAEISKKLNYSWLKTSNILQQAYAQLYASLNDDEVQKVPSIRQLSKMK